MSFNYLYDDDKSKKMTCCFIGQKDIDDSQHMIQEITTTIFLFIVKNNVKNFIFSGKNKFDCVCHKIVTKFQNEYGDIKRIKYNSKYDYLFDQDIDDNKNEDILDYDEFVECDTFYIAQEMIDASDVCIFYLDKNYLPKKGDKRIDKIETHIAYEYAIKISKKKNITIKNALDAIKSFNGS